MLTLNGHNGVISMDTTFAMNDLKYHLFTLINFDVHHIRIPLAWVITKQQNVNDSMEWLKVLKAKILAIMTN
jgi:phosphatidylserine decarboxylase